MKPTERPARVQRAPQKEQQAARERRTPKSGFSGPIEERLAELSATKDELRQLDRARQAGAQPETCIALLEIARHRKGAFTTGAEVVQLRQVGMQDDTIVELARMRQIKSWTPDMILMRQTGMSDAAILEIARYRVARRRPGGRAPQVGHRVRMSPGPPAERREVIAKRPVFSGRSFAALRNAGVSDQTLLELVRRSVPEKDVERLVRMRNRGASDAKILQRYPAIP